MTKRNADSAVMETAQSICESFRCLIREWLEGRDDFIPAIEAEKFVAEVDPRLLAEWLHVNAAHWVTAEMSGFLRSERRTALNRNAARSFASAADAATKGDPEPLNHFAVTYVVDADNTRRRVAEMTGADHSFVASNYEASGRYDLMLGAFHRAVAKRVGKKRTSEVMTEEQYDRLLRSIVKPS